MRAARIVMHVHSDWSYDGSWPLAAIARLMGRLGADAVLMSEHDDTFDGARFASYRAACAEASKEGATLVPGIEYSSADNSVHILSWGLSGFHGSRRPVMEILSRITSEGGVAVLAHPSRREAHAQVREEWVAHLSAVEIWNRKADGLAPSRHALDLIRRYQLPAVAGMDFHAARHLYPVYNRAAPPSPASCTETALVSALRRGSFEPVAFGLPVLGDSPGPLTTAARAFSALEGVRRPMASLRARRLP